jgi:hypothetical protein
MEIPKSEKTSTGLRPMRSEALPQLIMTSSWVKENSDSYITVSLRHSLHNRVRERANLQ